VPQLVHGGAVRPHKRDAPPDAIKDDLVVAHVGRANHGAVVLIVKDAEAPHAGPQLVCVLARAEPYADAVPKEQMLVSKGV